MGVPFSDDEKQTFLDALAKCGVIGDAMLAAGIANRPTVTAWRNNDPEFAAAYDDAIEASRDKLESEARRRAVEGVTKLKFYPKGHKKHGQSYEELDYSDSLLMFMLKGERSEKFAERTKSEISGPGGGPIEANDTATAARIAALLDAARRRREQEGEIDDDPLFG